MSHKFWTALLTLPLLAACGTPQPPVDANKLDREPLTAEQKVTVIEFSDFNCPACKASHKNTRELRALSGVHFELHHFPLGIAGHETSPAAANAYECAAAQGYGKEMETALFEYQEPFTQEWLLAVPARYSLPLDTAKYSACVKNEEFKKRVDDDYQTAIALKLNGTPAFIVNGETVMGGPQVEEKVKALLAK